jgi:hypothetical protein
MQNDNEQMVRPFARIMANEVSHDEVELIAQKGSFYSVMSGPAFNDAPDIGIRY